MEQATNRDYELVTEWLRQEPPSPEELTEEDVLCAYIASDVLTHYRQHDRWNQFSLDNTMAGMDAEAGNWRETLARVQRGVAVLNGYLLMTNVRVPVWQEAPEHEDAIVSREFGAGYVASQEMHRTMSLLSANDLITLSAAAAILHGENTQSKRVMVKEDVTYGYLQAFTDKTENNPQKSLRVSKRQVLSLLYQRKR